MCRSITTRIAQVAALAVLLAAPVAMAEETCTLTGPMMTKEAIIKILQDRGYTQVRSVTSHNGCYEARGIDSKGHRFELELHGSTGEIMRVE